MVLPENLTDLEKAKFVEDAKGNTASLTVIYE